jgi:hypothetical protein
MTQIVIALVLAVIVLIGYIEIAKRVRARSGFHVSLDGSRREANADLEREVLDKSAFVQKSIAESCGPSMKLDELEGELAADEETPSSAPKSETLKSIHLKAEKIQRLSRPSESK